MSLYGRRVSARPKALPARWPAAALAVFAGAAVWNIPRDAVSRDWPNLAADLVSLLFAAAWFAWCLRFRRTPAAVLRASLTAAAAKIKGDDAWLARDDHAVFTVERTLGTHLRVWQEDDFRAIASEGRGTVVSLTYAMPSFLPTVIRHTDGLMITGGVSDPQVVKSRGRIGDWWDAAKTFRPLLRGMLRPDLDEMRVIIGQLERAEKISAPDA